MNRLSARAVQTISRIGRHADGGNLYLSISKTGSKSWLFIYRAGPRQREMGLGSVLNVTLAQARERAAQARQALGAGNDPLALKCRSSAVPTFGEMADRHIAAMESSWRNDKHRAQWRSTIATYAASLKSIPVDKVTTPDVIKVLSPIWNAKPETASRVRGRSSRFWTRRELRAFSRARIRRGGAGISIMSYRSQKNFRGVTTPRCPMTQCQA